MDGLKSGRGGYREGGGRPKGSVRPEGRRDKNIGIRVNADELAMVKEKAEKAGLGMTDFILECVKAYSV